MATGRVPTTANSPLTAKGDLFGYSTTQARVPVGSNGETLVADSSASTGLRWGTNFGWTAGKNKIINGDFSIWQRGTSFNITTINTYTADRWLESYSTALPTTYTVSQQSFTAGDALGTQVEGTYFLRSALTNRGTATDVRIMQRIEDVRTFADRTITISFWAKADAARTLTVLPVHNFGSGGSATVSASSSQNVNLTTSWARYSLTFAIASISGKTIGAGSYLELRFIHPNENSTIDFFGVQAEAGFVATNFQTATGTLAGELAACQRYYWRQNSSAAATNAGFGQGISTSATSARIYPRPPVTMRVAPTAVEYANLAISDKTAYTLSVTNVVLSGVQPDSFDITVTNNTGATASRAAILQADTSSSAYIAFSAEL